MPYNLYNPEETPKLYELIDLFGNGYLVDLMKLSMKSNNYAQLDEYIRTNVVSYLYNDGQGMHVPIELLVMHRAQSDDEKKRLVKEKKDKEEKRMRMMEQKDKLKNLAVVNNETSEQMTRFVCFDITKRGRIGETLLHLCLMNFTDVHNELAKRLLMHFPHMINDIFISNDYYGQTALHLAIVNEDLPMVAYLLQKGANIHERCCGAFFCPDDQKEKRKSHYDVELPVLPASTNYKSISYFGEYPLSFAAVVNQEDIVRYLIASNADLCKQDSNGNTVLHMMVINNNLPLFKLLFDSDPTNQMIHIKNKLNFSPFTLSVKLARKEMYDYLIEKMRKSHWTYGDIKCAAYPMRQIDSIQDDGKIDLNSVLHLVFYSETEEHLNFLEGFIVDLLYKKWTLFIRFRFCIELICYLVYFVLSATTIMLKRNFFDTLNSTLGCLEHTSKYTDIHEKCSCVYLTANDQDYVVRTIFELIVFFIALIYILVTCYEIYIQRLSYGRTLLNNPSKVIFLIANLCIVSMLPLRLSCLTDAEDILVDLSISFMSSYVLYFARGFPYLSTYVYVIHRVVKTNFLSFFLIYAIFLMGFSQCFYVVHELGQPDSIYTFKTPLLAIFDSLITSITEIQYDGFLVAEYGNVGKPLLFIYLLMVTLLLLNLFIAMMLNTYEDSNSREKEWLRQWGQQILAIEQNLYPKQRLKHQQKYVTRPLADDTDNPKDAKMLINQWKQKFDERQKTMEMSSMDFRTNLFSSTELDNYSELLEKEREEQTKKLR